MKVLNDILWMVLIFLIGSLFFLKSELRTPTLSLLIFSMIIGIIINTYLIKRKAI